MSILEIKSIAKAFGSTRAVDGVSFQVEPGEIYGLLGPNGAGKTTTISIACGLLKPDAGEVRVDGSSFWSDPVKTRRVMGVVPQDLALYEELTGRENLIFWGQIAGLGKAEAKKKASGLLDALSMSDRANDTIKHYSGGMKRRINLGCALMHQPKLLLLDEPTVGIDPQARASILDFVRDLAKNGTGILYTTHYLEEAESLCQRIGIIDKGRILAEGSLSELQSRLGKGQLYSMEAAFGDAPSSIWDQLGKGFRIVQQSDTQVLVAPHSDRDPTDCLRELLELPIHMENVTLKRPSLNDVFLQLTGRELRD